MGARKYMLTIWSLGENLLFGGLTFGWALLVIILKDEGVYAGLCTASNTSENVSTTTPPIDSSEEYVQTCIAQERQLNLVFTVAVVVRALSGPFIGQLLYRRGVRATRIVMVICLSAGLLMIAFTSVDIPWLLFPGLTFMAVGGEALFSSNIQAAYLFQSGSSFVVSLMSGMFDASASVMLIIKIVYDRGVARLYSFLTMAGAFILLASISSIFFLPKTFFKDGEPVRYRKRSTPDVTVTAVSDGKVYQRRASITSAEFRSNIIPPLQHCVLSPVFLSHVLWFSILQLRWYFYLGAFNTWITLVSKGSEEQIHFFTDVSLYVQLCSVVMALVSGVVLGFERRRCSDKPTSIQRRLRPSLSLQAIACILAIVLSSVILVPSTDILYFVFIVAIALRTLIYGMGAAYIQMIFPVEYFGFLFGVLMCAGGVIGCFQYLLFVWMETNPISPQKVNIFLLVLTVISLIHPVHIWIICRRAAIKAANGERRVDKLENYDFLLRKRK
ncbi:equilibrative nucleobase transporter 1-like [Liolophura sinensis]|uniref:equilibrative nucleobase transporter 1-like n=1 Tax=Liolophura sinensis TaxID=3198878 RepID=UPI003158B726